MDDLAGHDMLKGAEVWCLLCEQSFPISAAHRTPDGFWCNVHERCWLDASPLVQAQWDDARYRSVVTGEVK